MWDRLALPLAAPFHARCQPQVYVLMAWLPTFYEKGLKMDLANNTVLNFVPFLVMFIFSNLSGVTADRLIGKQGVPVGRARKLLNTAGERERERETERQRDRERERQRETERQRDRETERV